MGTDAGTVAAKDHGIDRSSKWEGVRKAFLKTSPYCAACKAPTGWKKLLHHGKALVGLKPVQVHHQVPFHLCVNLGRPDLELDPRNLISLCEAGESHHLVLGHLNDFKSYNPNIAIDAKHFCGKTKVEIVADPHWQKISHARPQPLDKMSDADKAAFRALMDSKFPLKT
jgi:hypothetical protein